MQCLLPNCPFMSQRGMEAWRSLLSFCSWSCVYGLSAVRQNCIFQELARGLKILYFLRKLHFIYIYLLIYVYIKIQVSRPTTSFRQLASLSYKELKFVTPLLPAGKINPSSDGKKLSCFCFQPELIHGHFWLAQRSLLTRHPRGCCQWSCWWALWSVELTGPGRAMGIQHWVFSSKCSKSVAKGTTVALNSRSVLRGCVCLVVPGQSNDWSSHFCSGCGMLIHRAPCLFLGLCLWLPGKGSGLLSSPWSTFEGIRPFLLSC